MTCSRPILHPTDFSVDSALAFRMACSMARDIGARLIVLHVRPDPTSEDRADVVDEVLWKQLGALRPEDPATRFEHRLGRGAAVDQILRVAKDSGCDLIVMGTGGRRGLRRFFTASVAEQVRRKAPCPVVTVQGASRLGHGLSATECREQTPAVAGAAAT